MSQGGCLTRSGNSKKAQLEQGEGGERQEAWGQITLDLVNGGKFLDFYSKWNKKLVKDLSQDEYDLTHIVEEHLSDDLGRSKRTKADAGKAVGRSCDSEGWSQEGQWELNC